MTTHAAKPREEQQGWHLPERAVRTGGRTDYTCRCGSRIYQDAVDGPWRAEGTGLITCTQTAKAREGTFGHVFSGNRFAVAPGAITVNSATLEAPASTLVRATEPGEQGIGHAAHDADRGEPVGVCLGDPAPFGAPMVMRTAAVDIRGGDLLIEAEQARCRHCDKPVTSKGHARWVAEDGTVYCPGVSSALTHQPHPDDMVVDADIEDANDGEPEPQAARYLTVDLPGGPVVIKEGDTLTLNMLDGSSKRQRVVRVGGDTLHLMPDTEDDQRPCRHCSELVRYDLAADLWVDNDGTARCSTAGHDLHEPDEDNDPPTPKLDALLADPDLTLQARRYHQPSHPVPTIGGNATFCTRCGTELGGQGTLGLPYTDKAGDPWCPGPVDGPDGDTGRSLDQTAVLALRAEADEDTQHVTLTRGGKPWGRLTWRAAAMLVADLGNALLARQAHLEDALERVTDPDYEDD